MYGHPFVGVDLPVLVGSVFGRSWEALALDSVPKLADVCVPEYFLCALVTCSCLRSTGIGKYVWAERENTWMSRNKEADLSPCYLWQAAFERIIIKHSKVHK